MKPAAGTPSIASQREAQESADRIRQLRQELATAEIQQVLSLTPDQYARFDEWSRARLGELARQFDVDTSTSERRVSWGMRIASTLGGIATCTAVVLFFARYWGYLGTPFQVTILAVEPILFLAAAEFAATRERTPYFTGLLALVALASFMMNLAVLGAIFNIGSTERALLAWGAFALLLAYRYGLRLQLAAGLLLLIGYCAAQATAQPGYRWLDFAERPELVAMLAVVVFCVPFAAEQVRNGHFPPVYRLIGALVFFLALVSLAEWGIPSFLPFSPQNVERLYEFAGLLLSAGAIWLGIARQWNNVVNTSAVAFAIFLFTRLYRWWWDWMPGYLFFAVIGALGILLVFAFRHLRGQLAQRGALA